MFAGGQFWLDETHGVVTKRANQTAAKARQAGQIRDLEAGHEFADIGHRIGMIAAFGDAVAVEQQDAAVFDANAGAGGEADERITTEALATVHRFQQIGIRFVGQLEINRERCIEIGKGFQRHRYAVVASGVKPVEFGFIHGVAPHKN